MNHMETEPANDGHTYAGRVTAGGAKQLVIQISCGRLPRLNKAQFVRWQTTDVDRYWHGEWVLVVLGC